MKTSAIVGFVIIIIERVFYDRLITRGYLVFKIMVGVVVFWSYLELG